MGDVLVRKCTKCGETFEIDVDDVKDVIFFDKVYYHEKCFFDRANRCVSHHTANAKKWKNALENVEHIKKESKNVVRQAHGEDNLNKWLLDNYDLEVVPRSFWTLVSDLKNGKYRRKSCKPIFADTLCSMWMWGQQNLNKIAANNKAKGTGPSSEEDRLIYDVAILLSHTSSYIKSQQKSDTTVEEIKSYISHDEVDMSRIGQSKQTTKRDISDISDDLFVE